ncbi:hypothetical protein ACTFIU_005822 [Dictyostelium citrinum]
MQQSTTYSNNSVNIEKQQFNRIDRDDSIKEYSYVENRKQHENITQFQEQPEQQQQPEQQNPQDDDFGNAFGYCGVEEMVDIEEHENNRSEEEKTRNASPDLR